MVNEVPRKAHNVRAIKVNHMGQVLYGDLLRGIGLGGGRGARGDEVEE